MYFRDYNVPWHAGRPQKAKAQNDLLNDFGGQGKSRPNNVPRRECQHTEARAALVNATHSPQTQEEHSDEHSARQEVLQGQHRPLECDQRKIYNRLDDYL